MTPEEVAQLLENTASRLEGNGWRRGLLGPGEGPNCISGALSWQMKQQYGQMPSHRWMIAAGWIIREIGTERITFWNDNICVHGQHAAETLRLAAKHGLEQEWPS
jgi:hypothetical protein